MKEVTMTMYQALDGEVFDSAEECMAYEKNCGFYGFPDSFRLYDIDMYELRFLPNLVEYNEKELDEMAESIYNRAWYVILLDGPTLSADIDDMHSVFGFFTDIPKNAKPGLYQYNHGWTPVDLDREQEKCEEWMAKISAFRNLIKECESE